MKKYIWIFFLILFLIFVIFFLKQNLYIFEYLKEISFYYILLVFLLTIISLYINWLFLFLLWKPFNIEIKEHFLLSNTASFLNLVTPFRWWAWFRAWYMKKIYNLDYTYFASSLFWNYVIVFFVASFIAIIDFLYLFFIYDIFNLIVFIIFLWLFIIFGSIFFVWWKFYFRKENKITSKINKVLKWWELISKDKILVFKLCILTFINILVGVIVLYLLFLSIWLDIEFSKVFYISIISILSIFINITPWSIWITESLYMFSSNIVLIAPATMLLIALLKRWLEIIVLFSFGIVSKYILLKRMKKKRNII